MVVVTCGVALIVLGFIGWHAEVAAIVIGLILVGCLSGDMLVKILSRARNGAGSAEPEGHAPSAGSVHRGRDE